MPENAELAADIKIGDLLYAVGPSRHAPEGPADLKLYSAVIKNVRIVGSYSASATAADLASAPLAIDLDDARPVLGFPRWTYASHEIGISVHRTATDALRAFAKHAQRCKDAADRARDRAAREIAWAEMEYAEIKQCVLPWNEDAMTPQKNV